MREGPLFAIYDLYPVTPRHTLLITSRHVASSRDLTPEEWLAVHRLAIRVCDQLKLQDPSIEGFNLGVNDGEVAGQSVFHMHFHVIPRRRFDVPVARGGIRGIIPGKADYPG